MAPLSVSEAARAEGFENNKNEHTLKVIKSVAAVPTLSFQRVQSPLTPTKVEEQRS